jgi:hypothetical protein
MRSIAVLPFCFLFFFLSITLGAALPLQTSAPKAAATAQKEFRSADSHYRRGVELARAGRDDEAVQEFERSIELDPTRFEAYKGLDDLLSRKRDWPTIIDYWTRYLQQAPNDGRAYDERSGTYSHLRDMASAVRDADKACSLGIVEACQAAAIWRRNGARAVPLAQATQSGRGDSLVPWAVLALFALIPIAIIVWLVSYLRSRQRGVTAPGMLSAKEISMQDGRLVLSTPRSVGVITILGMLLFVGVGVWGLLSSVNQSFKSPGEKINVAVFFVIFLVAVAVVIRKAFPKVARLAEKGEVIVFDRQRDVLVKDNQPLAHLSSVSKVQINMYVKPFTSGSERFDWSVSVFGRDDKELVEIRAGYQGEAHNIAQLIAEYTGTQITSAQREGTYF